MWFIYLIPAVNIKKQIKCHPAIWFDFFIESMAIMLLSINLNVVNPADILDFLWYFYYHAMVK